MFKLLTVTFTLVLLVAPALSAQSSTTAGTQQTPTEQPVAAVNPEAQPLPAMSEYRGVKLGMAQAEVKTLMGKASQHGKNWDEFKLGDDSLMTVRYDDRQVVRTIQLYFAGSKQAPSWAEVVGQAQIQEKPTGSKYARAENGDERFWVTMFQSKDGGITTITVSR